MTKILLIEDDIYIQELVRTNLEKEGFTVIPALDGEQGLNLARREEPDLILLDLTLPLIDGYDVCKILRDQTDTVAIPIIIISARDDVADKIIGLELGADDYMTKPFSHRELYARIKARLREGQRKNELSTGPLKWGDLEIVQESYIATIEAKPLNLTVKEFELLVLFVANPYQVFSREYLIQKVWGHLSSTDSRTLDVHISHLRNKLKAVGPVVESVRGVGYLFARR
ncbi:response regulator transcription factor [Desulfosporosinus fructosivorans]|uniref:Stage 0 sporulation protein A homolog n=1 Tax=Desulfosporosinus fructosivorans TaxID=2018669 RepID=A0A4Z0R8I0_9FIRM|nr:response regulator transcription factor [Desulfosporosinus fructosivorans]TGE38735.1 response regulator transcription factor [Desulfosporosinus fructosivorans]